MPLRIKSFVLLALAILPGLCLVSCGTSGKPTRVVTDGVVVSVKDQKLAVLRRGEVVKTYKVSTSKFGVGDQKGSCRTPLGTHSVAAKIGDNAPPGTVFKSRRPTGEIVCPNSPGRDPIVTRIIWLRGHEPQNRNAFARMIYIHGTTEENRIGSPASYGCIRMKSSDIQELYPYVRKGEPVVIERCSLKASTDAAYALAHARQVEQQSGLLASARNGQGRMQADRSRPALHAEELLIENRVAMPKPKRDLSQHRG